MSNHRVSLPTISIGESLKLAENWNISGHESRIRMKKLLVAEFNLDFFQNRALFILLQ